MTWQKGQSGNPSGITAMDVAVAKVLDQKALDRLDSLIADPDARAAWPAVKWVLDRRYPIPKQTADRPEAAAAGDDHLAVLKRRAHTRRETQALEDAADKAKTVDVRIVSTLPKGANNE